MIPRLSLALLFVSMAALHGESQTSSLPLGEKLETISATFLGRRFKTDALGEGPGQYDSDPLARTDAFDCTTFVETVWAIHRTKAGQDWTKSLQNIRYRDGKTNFFERLHFISVDWMSYHLQKGDVKDLTATLGLPIREARTLIDKRSWYAKKHPTLLKDFDKEFPKETAGWSNLAWLSFADLLDNPAAMNKLRSELGQGPLLVNFVRPNFDLVESIGTHIDITHQGLLILQDGKIMLRHASVTLMKVGDEDFTEYLKFYLHHPTLKGLQIVRLL